jgi:type I restriction enzyme S subunit
VINGLDLQEYVTGTAQPKLTQAALKRIPVPLPPLREQHEIVRRVDALFKLADAIEKRVAAATVRADKLTQAILAKAFRGELVPTEAELARQEGRDFEPASVLLEGIRAERAQANGASPPRKPRAVARRRGGEGMSK